MIEREEELRSLIDQLNMKLDKAQAGGSEREISNLKKEIKRFNKELQEIESSKGDSCGCSR